MRRNIVVIGVVLAALCTHAHVSVWAATLNDIESHPYKSSIELLQLNGIIGGYSDGSFRPYAPINRAEFLKILMLAVFGNNVYGVQDRNCFADFTGPEQWYWITACAAKKAGIVQGYPDGTFRGETTVGTAEALKMSFEAWNVSLPPADPAGPWYERYMSEGASRNVFKRLPFNAGYPLTRGEMALLLTMLGEPIASISGSTSSQSNTVTVTFPPPPARCGDGIVGGTEQCDDGNVQNGDGCSSLCIVVAEPIRHGALRLEQRSIIGDARASGTKDVLLFSIDALAGRQDIYLTTLKFKSAAGSLQNARNYRLLIDQDGDGKTESLFGKAEAQSESLTFGNLSILAKDGRYKRIELIADIVETTTAGSIAVVFDTSASDFVEGIGKMDGQDVTGI
ncbi:S-layer homology domain-containing protein, partial [Candidatus Peregrinibacteria bacterium]|nr:S-layer homology domain-containing protein [Candidatus Peregrinibacteria bacterium]